MRIVQITDSHIAYDIPQRLTDLKACIDAVNLLADAPDIVIHTGDITHNGLAEEFTVAKEALDTLTAPYVVLAGNKDDREQLQQAFSDHRYLQQHPKFIQYQLEQFPVRLIILDTVYDPSKTDTDTLDAISKGELCEERFQLLRKMLEHDTSKPAVLFMHHSPIVIEEIPDPRQFHDWSQVDRLATLLSRHHNLRSVHCGHVHRNIQGQIAQLPVSVLSCMATDLRKGDIDQHERTRPMYKAFDFAEII